MIYTYLQKHKLLSLQQSSFRPVHSTCTSLTNIPNTLLHKMDNYKGLLTGLIFLDLSKAFHTLDHIMLLEKLVAFGFDESSVQCFNTSLTELKVYRKNSN